MIVAQVGDRVGTCAGSSEQWHGRNLR